jgi:NAD(P)-dependent dehydrogenase (short-subunit alcohol dehydrogenase family)
VKNQALANKVAVVTGGSHGLGKAVAGHLALLGADLVLIGRDAGRLTAVSDALEAQGARVLPLVCDISDPAAVQAAADRIMAGLGRADVLVNNAGIPAPRTFADTRFEDWDAVMGANLSGAFYLTRALWDGLVQSGSGYVITISGSAGVRGGSSPAYGSAKFGLTGLNHAIAVAGKDHGIRATILYPGGMDTGWRGAPVGVRPRSESMDPGEVARLVGYLVTTPPEFVLNEAVLNPISTPYL